MSSPVVDCGIGDRLTGNFVKVLSLLAGLQLIAIYRRRFSAEGPGTFRCKAGVPTQAPRSALLAGPLSSLGCRASLFGSLGRQSMLAPPNMMHDLSDQRGPETGPSRRGGVGRGYPERCRDGLYCEVLGEGAAVGCGPFLAVAALGCDERDVLQVPFVFAFSKQEWDGSEREGNSLSNGPGRTRPP